MNELLARRTAAREPGSEGNETMSESDARRAGDDWAGGQRPMPEPFVLVGYHGPYVANDHGAAPLLIDAEGVRLSTGAVFAWCHGGCCTDRPRRWETVDAAAEYHGSYIIDATGHAREATTQQ